MKTLQAFAKAILFWFTSYLLIYVCFSIVTAVMAAHAEMHYSNMMLEAMPLYCLICTVVSTLGVIMYMREIGLLQKSIITENQDYDPDKIKDDEQQVS
jgi:FtsH-binding integral membrane protein